MKETVLLSAVMIVLFGGWILYGCAPAIDQRLLPPAEDLATASSADQDELALGRKYYLQQCGGCHRHRMPNEFSPRQWKVTLMYHKGRPHLSTDEYEKLKRYILPVSDQTHQKGK